MFDTGSANSWILSKENMLKKPKSKQKEHFSFDKSLSTTFDEPDDDDKQWVKITFGSGSLRGYFAHDKCTLGS